MDYIVQLFFRLFIFDIFILLLLSKIKTSGNQPTNRSTRTICITSIVFTRFFCEHFFGKKNVKRFMQLRNRQLLEFIKGHVFYLHSMVSRRHNEKPPPTVQYTTKTNKHDLNRYNQIRVTFLRCKDNSQIMYHNQWRIYERMSVWYSATPSPNQRIFILYSQVPTYIFSNIYNKWKTQQKCSAIWQVCAKVPGH